MRRATDVAGQRDGDIPPEGWTSVEGAAERSDGDLLSEGWSPVEGAARGGDFRAELYGRYVSTFKSEPSWGAEPAFAWWDHKYLPLLEGLERSAPVLEIGCGGGGLLAYLARRGFSHATGIDISAEQIALARQRGVHAEQADIFAFLADRAPRSADAPRRAADALPRVADTPQSLTEAPPDFADAPPRFAAILAVDVFEHFARDELVRLAPLLYAALQPGGRLIVQTANGAGLFPRQVIYGDLTHMTIFTPESLAQLLRRVGFTDFAFAETGPIPIRLRGKIDVALWAGLKAIANTVRSIETGKRQAIWTENFICRAFKR